MTKSLFVATHILPQNGAWGNQRIRANRLHGYLKEVGLMREGLSFVRSSWLHLRTPVIY